MFLCQFVCVSEDDPVMISYSFMYGSRNEQCLKNLNSIKLWDAAQFSSVFFSSISSLMNRSSPLDRCHRLKIDEHLALQFRIISNSHKHSIYCTSYKSISSTGSMSSVVMKVYRKNLQFNPVIRNEEATIIGLCLWVVYSSFVWLLLVLKSSTFDLHHRTIEPSNHQQ